MGGLQGHQLVITDLINLGNMNSFFRNNNYVYTTITDHVELIFTVATGQALIVTNSMAYKIGGTVSAQRIWVNDGTGTTVNLFSLAANQADYTETNSTNPFLIPAGFSLHLGTNVTATNVTAYVQINGILIAYSGG